MNTTQSSNGWRWVGLGILLAILLILWLMGLGPSFSGDQPGCCGVAITTPPVSVPTQPPVVTAPAPEPVKSAVNLGLSYENGKVTLTGTVPTEADRQKLVTAARDSYGGDNVIDRLTLAANASLPGWWSQLTNVINGLKNIADYGLNQSGDGVTLTGAVASEAEKAAKEAELKSLLGDNVVITNLLAIKAPETVAAPIKAKEPKEHKEPKVACSADMNVAINFANNSANLSAKGKAQLNEIAKCLRKPTVVRGHTDNYGDDAYNQQLSKARAKVVITYIKAINPAKAKLLTAAGSGEKRPLASNAHRTGRARNRRIEFHSK